MRPVHMPVEVMEHFYRGGHAIRALRGGPQRCERSPEEWLASVTARFGAEPAGLSRLPDGAFLRDAIAADPQGWLGADHHARFGARTGVLAKLLDAGERLPVHLHPDRDFARQHLSCGHGKTEAWIVLAAEPGATAHLGFSVPVDRAELTGLVQRQDPAELLSRMHEVPLHAGDTVLVPAGLPHALGAGAFVLEVQEPTDFSILLDWRGFALDGPAEGHLGLGFDLALEAVRRDPLRRGEVEALRLSGAANAGAADHLRRLLAEEAEPYFRADLVRPATSAAVPAGFAVLVVLHGSGELRTRAGEHVGLARGDVLAVPHAAGPLSVRGDVTAVLCRPPEPTGPRPAAAGTPDTKT
ncbi:mannose-6-phosphate isomerase [Lipingzhangella halophila]|uniref:Mannose-6-phosphate isomerase n=1 Tax=Lipingzhangella halophila TaxID=1783352 RepID=A0A7W7RD52_9ACTN|nr:hypothetical protein [Lipingzhangella halophila]MBB4929793.1 mannose-6-phosphate isomerase [Lipingzhangella halophila]